MKNFTFTVASTLLFAVALLSCNSKPTVVEAVKSNAGGTTEAKAVPVKNDASATHKVVVEDYMHATRYTYLDVTEDGNRFWIAIPRTEDIEKGGTYFYKGGLLKRNFRSTEHNRTFETIYLVSGVRQQPSFEGGSAVDRALATLGDEQDQVPQDIAPPEGGISLETLFENRDEYKDKNVKVRGKVVKVNPQIMGRNWVHIQDGSKKGDSPLDLTITTDANVQVGSVVTFTGKITLNKDFGSGYFYALIMEEAHTHE